MPLLDQKSYLVLVGMIGMAATMSLLMACVVFLLRRNDPGRMQGLACWALAPLLWVPAYVLFALRGWLPEGWSVLAANGLGLTGALLFHAGTRRFLGGRLGWQPWLLGFGATMAALAVLTYGVPSFTGRVALISLSVLVMQVAQLRFLLRSGNTRFPVRVMQGVLAAHIAVLALRLATTLLGSTGDPLHDPSLLQTAYLGAYAVVQLLLEICGVLMAADRLHTDLEQLATRDPLTQTWNRRALLQHGERELALCRRHGQPLSLLMIDLDHFKQINDTHGHQRGDEVLQHFARIAGAQLRSTDFLGRHGGEEFVALLPHTPLADVVHVADRLRQALADSGPLACTASVGATAGRDAQDTLAAMLTRADEALYRAKRAGRDRLELAP